MPVKDERIFACVTKNKEVQGFLPHMRTFCDEQRLMLCYGIVIYLLHLIQIVVLKFNCKIAYYFI